jgi:hypothetical protein
MQLKNSKERRIVRCLLFFSMLLVTCPGLQTSAAAQDLFSLQQGGPHPGAWESSDVVVDFKYMAEQGTFKLNIGGKAKRSYDQLSVWIKFLDAQGKVLEKKSIYNSGFRQKLLRAEGRLEKTYEIPPGSTQFAFHSMLKLREGR